MSKTLEQVRTEGLLALRSKLGRAGMIRFLQQFHSGDGDYTTQRRPWVDHTSLEDIRSLAQKRRKKSPISK